MTPRRRAVAVLLSCLPLVAVACGDGTPAFCGPLADSADLSALSAALDAGDLEKAASEAQRLKDLAEEAPATIRADFVALADGVVDIVDLIAQERDANAVTSDTSTDTVDPGEVERRRDELNARLGELDRRSDRISAWATEQCGLNLS